WTCGYWGQTNNQNSMAVAELKSPYTFFTSTNNKASESYKPVIYPNPVTGGVFTLEFNNPKTQKINVKLVDINGKLVKTLLKDNLKGGKHQANLLIQNITPATYFLVIESEVGLLKTEKVVFGN